MPRPYPLLSRLMLRAALDRSVNGALELSPAVRL